MQNKDTTILLVIHAKPDFPTYFRHPIWQELQKQGLNLHYVDTDSHSDDFYIDFIMQALSDKKRIFVCIEIDAQQKKLPNNCLKILSHFHKMKEKVHILYSVPNIILSAYTKNFSVCTETDMQKQVEYIVSKSSEV
jgi:hypothetical protein